VQGSLWLRAKTPKRLPGQARRNPRKPAGQATLHSYEWVDLTGEAVTDRIERAGPFTRLLAHACFPRLASTTGRDDGQTGSRAMASSNNLQSDLPLRDGRGVNGLPGWLMLRKLGWRGDVWPRLCGRRWIVIGSITAVGCVVLPGYQVLYGRRRWKHGGKVLATRPAPAIYGEGIRMMGAWTLPRR